LQPALSFKSAWSPINAKSPLACWIRNPPNTSLHFDVTYFQRTASNTLIASSEEVSLGSHSFGFRHWCTILLSPGCCCFSSRLRWSVANRPRLTGSMTIRSLFDQAQDSFECHFVVVDRRFQLQIEAIFSESLAFWKNQGTDDPRHDRDQAGNALSRYFIWI